MKVIVVGAGAAGLAATHELMRQGIEPVVLEDKGRVGGRISRVFEEGYIFDLGAQFLNKSFATTFALCRQLGLMDEVTSFHLKIDMWGKGRLFTLEVKPSPKALMDDLSYLVKNYSPGGFVNLLRLALTAAKRRKDLSFTEFEGLLDLDGENLADFTVRRFGEEVLENFVQPLLSSLSTAEPEEAGSAAGLLGIWLAIGGLFGGLLTMKKGLGSIADSIYQKNRGLFKLETPATRVVIEKGKARGVETADGFIEADAVVCATTATTALRLMPDLPDALRLPLGKTGYSECCHVMFGLEDRVLEPGHYWIALPRKSGSPIAAIGCDSARSPHFAPAGGDVLHCFTYGKHATELNRMDENDIIEAMVSEVRRHVPAMPEKPQPARICRWNESLYLAPPGSLRAISRMKKDSYHGVRGLRLAGSYLYMPGVEGAFFSGVRAAQSLLGASS